MKKHEWFFIILPIAAVILVDQVSKGFALQLTEAKTYGYFGFALHFNKGAMLGLFSGLPPILRVVSLSTGGAFLLFTYVIIQYLLPIRSMLLRVGMSILMGGILGNVIDRTLSGHVVDFLFFTNGTWHSPVMNIADMLQWVGYACVVIALLKDGELLWPQNNLRKFYWIKPRYQLKYCFLMMFVGMGFASIAGVFSYTFLKFVLEDLVGRNTSLLTQFLTPFVITFSIFSACFAAFLFMIGKKLSHQSAGPVYAFERFLNDFLAGKKHKLKLRSGDEFLELEAMAQLILERLELKDQSSSASSLKSSGEMVPILPKGQGNIDHHSEAEKTQAG